MRAADLTPVARDVMRLPASGGVIFFSFVAAFGLSALEWQGGWLLLRPDFVLLVLLFWAMHEPRTIGQGVAFTLGLLMDVSDSMLLGQHALAYVIAIYGAQLEQTLHVLGLFVLAAMVMLLLNLLLGAEFPGLAYFISPILTALAWGPVSGILFSPTVRRRRREATS
jgi:rod shape-determining protein MreD